MKWYKSKAFLTMLAVIICMGGSIYAMSYRIQSQMEKAAAENVREIVQIVESGISEIRRNDIASAENLADLFVAQGDMQQSLKQLQKNSPFERISFVPCGASEGISSSKNEFSPEKIPGLEDSGSDILSVSEVYMSDLGAWTYTVQSPVYEQGQLAGRLYADVIMERYDDILPGSIFQGEGLVYILDADTLRFIYEPTSTSAFVSSKYDLHGFLRDFGIMDDAVEKNISTAIEKQKSTIARMVINDETAYVYFWPVDEGAWYLCGIIPERSIQGESKAVTQTIAGVGAIVFISVGLIFGLIYWYSRRNQKARQYQIDLFHGIAKSIDDVVLLYDDETGKLELSFDNIERILGVDAQTLYEGSRQNHTAQKNGDTQLQGLLRLENFRTKDDFTEKVKWNNPETGNRQYLVVEMSHIVLDKASKYIISIRDITKDEQMQESLRTSVLAAQNASRVKSDFLSRMSHEIRTPMNAVTGMAQIAEVKIDDKEKVQDCLQKIESSSRHLLGLINDILDISKIESQKMSLSESWFPLEGLLENLVSIISMQAGIKNQTFKVNNMAGSVELLADQVRLSQILMNLLNNSVKYTQRGGCITLTVEKKESKAKDYCLMHFKIQDNGIGMSEEFQKKLFTPFEREDDEAVHEQTGTGLGMAIVQSMVSLMGGSIRVMSTKGEGTTFYIDAEFKQKSVEQVKPVILPKQEVLDLTGVKILLAEDNELNREITTAFLEMANTQTDCAEDGVEAFEKFRDSKIGEYQLILMDMQMPGWDGLEATRQIRSLERSDAKTIPIIAVTANAYTEDAQKCLEAGMNDHVAKPLNMQEFYQKVKKYLPGMADEGGKSGNE